MTNETIVVIIKLLHTVIFLFVSGCILYVLVCAISGRTSPKLMNAAAIVPTVIGILWLLNGHECLLASVVYRLSGGDRSIADIYFPDWFSRWIMTGSTLLMIVAGCLVLWRTLTHRWEPRKQ